MREQSSQTLPSRLLWYLSCRNKKDTLRRNCTHSFPKGYRFRRKKFPKGNDIGVRKTKEPTDRRLPRHFVPRNDRVVDGVRREKPGAQWRGLYRLFPNSQKATALAAATFNESTPWDMGIITVKSQEAMVFSFRPSPSVPSTMASLGSLPRAGSWML